MKSDLRLGDSRDVLKTLAENSVSACVTDPPYGLISSAKSSKGFMGNTWDGTGIEKDPRFWSEVLRVLKPGAHVLAFGGTRTWHRIACAIEDAGFEIRDTVCWVYGSGFPKSHNLDGDNKGWGTALKPAFEPVIMARKPLSEKTVAENVLRWGTGAINIDGCRVGNDTVGWSGGGGGKNAWKEKSLQKDGEPRPVQGRWPANLIHDGSDDALELFPETTPARAGNRGEVKIFSDEIRGKEGWTGEDSVRGHNDCGGSAARFFYCAKASKRDRNEGCENLPLEAAGGMQGRNDGSLGSITYNNNTHATVKPTALMQYLCRLVAPKNGIVLDPFMGSGSTGKAAVLEGFNFIGIEAEPKYFEIARSRIAWAEAQGVGNDRI